MWARLKLYRDVLDKLQERVRYTDTDLIIFRCDPGIPVRVPDFLGELTPELKPRQHIDEFAFVGCKNYTCKVASRGTCSQHHKG